MSINHRLARRIAYWPFPAQNQRQNVGDLTLWQTIRSDIVTSKQASLWSGTIHHLARTPFGFLFTTSTNYLVEPLGSVSAGAWEITSIHSIFGAPFRLPGTLQGLSRWRSMM